MELGVTGFEARSHTGVCVTTWTAVEMSPLKKQRAGVETRKEMSHHSRRVWRL